MSAEEDTDEIYIEDDSDVSDVDVSDIDSMDWDDIEAELDDSLDDAEDSSYE